MQAFFRSMGLDDLDKDDTGGAPSRLPTTTASTSNISASTGASTSGTPSSTASYPKMDSSKSMPQLAQVTSSQPSPLTKHGAREKEHKKDKEYKKDHHGAREKDRKEQERDSKSRERESQPKDRVSQERDRESQSGEREFLARDRDLESQASFSSKESGPSTTSSSTSKGRSPDHDPPPRNKQNVFLDWAPAWKGSTDSSSGGGFRPQWPPAVRDGSHPARGSNPAIDALGLGLGRLGSEGAKPRSRPGHAAQRKDYNGNNGSSSNPAHRPKSYHHHAESRHDSSSGDFYTRNPLDNSRSGREGVAVAGGRGQWQGSEQGRSQHPSISGKSTLSSKYVMKISHSM